MSVPSCRSATDVAGGPVRRQYGLCADEQHAHAEADGRVGGERDRGQPVGGDQVVEDGMNCWERVGDDSTTDEKHRRGAGNRQTPHQPRRGGEDATAQVTCPP